MSDKLTNALAGFGAVSLLFLIIWCLMMIFVEDDTVTVFDERAAYSISADLEQILMNPGLTDLEVRILAEGFILFRQGDGGALYVGDTDTSEFLNVPKREPSDD